MKTSSAGIKEIQLSEGVRLEAYQDIVDVWTIGYGHTSAAGDPKVVKGMKITKDEAVKLLQKDLKSYEDAVLKYVKVPLNQNQFDALVSFTFNLGPGALRDSTLLKKLNVSDYKGAANEFLKWNKAGGKTVKGLTDRRERERTLFLKATEKPVQEVSKEDAPVVVEKKNPFVELLMALLRLFTK